MRNYNRTEQMHWAVAYICVPLLMTILAAIVIFIGLKPVYTDLSMQLNGVMNIYEAMDDGSTFEVIQDQNAVKKPAKAVVESTPKRKREKVTEPGIGIRYGTLDCDRLDIHSDIYFGDNNEQLNLGVGTYPGSWIPGCGSTTLLAGHNNTDFTNLQFVEIGDVFTIKTSYGDYKYRVSEYTIVNETEVDACHLDSLEEQVVLYTCYPFYKISGRRTERFFVYLEKLSGPQIDIENFFHKDTKPGEKREQDT